jgi:hypothetical protein
MNRRTLLKGITGLTAGALILPPTLDENVEVAKRYWALDRTMLAAPQPAVWMSGDFDAAGAWRIIPIGAFALWDDGRVAQYPIQVLPNNRWRFDVPRHEFASETAAFSYSVLYRKQGDPEETIHTASFGNTYPPIA